MSVTTWSDVNLSSNALTAVVKRGSLGLAMKLLIMSVTTCSDVNLSSKALTAVMKRGSLGLARKRLLMRVTTCSGANLSTKVEGRHEARVLGPGCNTITQELAYLLGRDPHGHALKAVAKLRSSSLAGNSRS